jgi:hypothetical protein
VGVAPLHTTPDRRGTRRPRRMCQPRSGC